MTAKLNEIDMTICRFELLVDDYERAALSAVTADDIHIATLVRSLPRALSEPVELNQNCI